MIARDPSAVRTPADLAGRTVGVTGLPSDDAVLDAILRAGGLPPTAVHRVTIGFGAVPALVSQIGSPRLEHSSVLLPAQW